LLAALLLRLLLLMLLVLLLVLLLAWAPHCRTSPAEQSHRSPATTSTPRR
jgi:flagellar biogenesis protein FliO